MNKVVLVGRLVKNPDVRYSPDGSVSVASYILAVDRRRAKDGEQAADFISCKTFGKLAQNTEKYLTKGMKIGIAGKIQTGSYENKEGKRIYTTDVIVDEQEFMESKRNAETDTQNSATTNGENSQLFFSEVSDDDDIPF